MEIIKLMTNGYPQGVYAITKKEEVTDALLDAMNEGKEDKEFTKKVLETHLESGLCFIPPNEKPFDWNEELHGKFFT
jgi:hypothetical protein